MMGNGLLPQKAAQQSPRSMAIALSEKYAVRQSNVEEPHTGTAFESRKHLNQRQQILSSADSTNVFAIKTKVGGTVTKSTRHVGAASG